MNDKFTYSTLNSRLITFLNNIDSIVSNIESFESICSNALLVNDSCNYKDELTNIKNSIKAEKQNLKYTIIPEIKRNC